MQFAHEMNNPTPGAQEQPTEDLEQEDQVDEDDLDRLVDFLGEKDGDSQEVAEKKKELLEKIGEFGHFATTKVGYEAPAKVEEALEKESKAKARPGKKRSVPKQSLKENPLRSSGGGGGQAAQQQDEGIIRREDDPFRFVQN